MSSKEILNSNLLSDKIKSHLKVPSLESRKSTNSLNRFGDVATVNGIYRNVTKSGEMLFPSSTTSRTVSVFKFNKYESSEEELSASPLSSIEYLNFIDDIIFWKDQNPFDAESAFFTIRPSCSTQCSIVADTDTHQFPSSLPLSSSPHVVVSDHSSHACSWQQTDDEKNANGNAVREAECHPGSSKEKESSRNASALSSWQKLKRIVHCAPLVQTYRREKYPWVQLVGHSGSFKAGKEGGTILKKLCTREALCFEKLMTDPLMPYVPHFRGTVKGEDGEHYIQMEDLLYAFNTPCVMDCKLGIRTYLETELEKAKEKPKLRKDMYEKMMQIDPVSPTEEEHKVKGVTKPRYMAWRESISSTSNLGFRIEGIRKSDGKAHKDFKKTKHVSQIKDCFSNFLMDYPKALFIGTSLLFVHDHNYACVWLIDFAKTVPVPVDRQITHQDPWVVGNHEDGYLIGLNNIIQILESLS